MLLASSPWPDGQARRGFPGCLPSLCSICSHNKSSFTGSLSQMFSWKMCRGECLAKMGIGEKLWCFPLSSQKGHTEQGWGLAQRGLCRAQQEVEGGSAPCE